MGLSGRKTKSWIKKNSFKVYSFMLINLFCVDFELFKTASFSSNHLRSSLRMISPLKKIIYFHDAGIIALVLSYVYSKDENYDEFLCWILPLGFALIDLVHVYWNFYPTTHTDKNQAK